MDCGQTCIGVEMKQIGKLILMIGRIPFIQDSTVDCSLLCQLGIVLTKPGGKSCILNSGVNTSKNNDNNKKNKSNIVDTRSIYKNDNYLYTNEHNDKAPDDDQNNYVIDGHKNNDNSENKSNYCRSDSKTELIHSTKDNISHKDSILISNDDSLVRNTNDNIPNEIDIKHSTINKHETQTSDKIPTASLSTEEDKALLQTSQLNFLEPNIVSQEGNILAESLTIENQTQSLTIQFKSLVNNINTQEDIDDALGLPFNFQYMFDKRTSPWEMKDWDYEELNNFTIEPEMIDRLYHMVADDEDQNYRSWEICCRMEYKGEKYFVEMYANCDYTGFDCQGGGQVSITKLPDFFLENMVTMDQNPDQIYKSLREDGYNVQEPDLLHKVHPKFWNNAPMLKYLCHNAIYKHRDVLPHFKDELPKILAKSVDEFIKVKDWDNE